MDRYLHSTIYEFNQSVMGYWRNWERNVAWMTREISWWVIMGYPVKSEDKPKKRSDLFKLSIDAEEKKEKEKPRKITEQDLKLYEKIKFGLTNNEPLNGLDTKSDSQIKG